LYGGWWIAKYENRVVYQRRIRLIDSSNVKLNHRII